MTEREISSATLTTPTVLTTSSTIMASTLPQNKILYVWVPYAFFLLAIFIILTFSFIKHTKRVLRRRRVLLDYIEANVQCQRPRICRMFSPAIRSEEDARMFRSFSGEEHSPRFCQAGSSEYCRDGPGYRGSRRPVQYLRVPALGSSEALRSKHYGLEDSGQSVWFQNRMLFGHNNLGFSFDEDLGRSHVRHVIPSPQNNLPLLIPQGGNMAVRHGCLSHLEVIDSEHESQHSFVTGGSNTASSGARSVNSVTYDTVSKTEASADNSTHRAQNTPSANLSTASSDQGLELSSTGARSPRTCSHCGSALPASANKTTKTRPKKRPRYRRQSACSDPLDGNSVELDQPYNISEDDSRPTLKPVSTSETESQLSTSYSKRTTSAPVGGRDSSSTNMTNLTADSKSSSKRSSTTYHGARSPSDPTSPALEGLEVYTIEMSPKPDGQFSAFRQTSLPDSEPSSANDVTQLRVTTADSLRRTSSVCLPSHTHGKDHSPTGTRQKSHPSLLQPEAPFSRSISPQSSVPTTPLSLVRSPYTSSASTSAAAATSNHKEDSSIFWLSGNSRVQQTLV